MAFSYSPYQESDQVKKLRTQLDQYQTYNESEAVKTAYDRLQQHENNRVADWTGGQYGEQLKGAVDKINNRQKFTYDLNGDALYQQYKDRYINQGKLAMQDTVGQVSALTGGYGNSYAATAGSQAYQQYLTGLNDIVPQLYEMAREAYNDEGEQMLNQYNVLNSAYNQEYGQWRDQVGDWNTEANRLADMYFDTANLDYTKWNDSRNYFANAYNNERNFDYGQYEDAYARALNEYNMAMAEAAAAAASGGGGGGGGGSNKSPKYSDSEKAAYAAGQNIGASVAANNIAAMGISGNKNSGLIADLAGAIAYASSKTKKK